MDFVAVFALVVLLKSVTLYILILESSHLMSSDTPLVSVLLSHLLRVPKVLRSGLLTHPTCLLHFYAPSFSSAVYFLQTKLVISSFPQFPIH